jgi:hypothetical protein
LFCFPFFVFRLTFSSIARLRYAKLNPAFHGCCRSLTHLLARNSRLEVWRAAVRITQMGVCKVPRSDSYFEL